MTTVVKLGGAAGNAIAPVVDELAAGSADVVLVHGGSEEVDRLATALGRPSEYLTSPSGVVSRRCDPEDLEIVTLALAGRVQTEIVRSLGARGVRAVGLSGVDGRVLLARRRRGVRAVVDGRVVHRANDRSGTVETVDVGLLRTLLAAGLVPVVGPPAVTADGELVNVDADRVAADVAAALAADALVLLTNVPGLLARIDDPSSVIGRVDRSRLEEFLPLAHGRMKKKLLAAQAALEGGVARVAIAASSHVPPIARALAGDGTVIA